jgi:hypothetical protein
MELDKVKQMELDRLNKEQESFQKWNCFFVERLKSLHLKTQN